MVPPPAVPTPAGNPLPEDAQPWRRCLGRLVDWLLVGGLTAWLLWPRAARELPGIGLEAGVTGVFQFLFTHLVGASVQTAGHEALSKARELLSETFAMQVLVVWVYEVVFTTVTGWTPGKWLLRVCIGFPGLSLRENILPAMVRATTAVWPGGIAVSAALVVLTRSWTALVLALVFGAIAVLDGAMALDDGLAGHDTLSSSRALDMDLVVRPSRHRRSPGNPRDKNKNPYGSAGRPNGQDPHKGGAPPPRPLRPDPHKRNPYR
jgi:hypothetical protein